MSIPCQIPSRNHKASSVARRAGRVRHRLLLHGLERCEDRILMANVSILGTAQSFAVLGATTVTNTGPSIITGDLGVSPGTAITGFPPGVVTGGSQHANDGVAVQAHADIATAYTAVAGEASTATQSGILDGLTLLPGVYTIATSATLAGTLTLDAQGDPNAQFTFQIGTTLITASGSAVSLINGARSDNVFFQVGSSATLGTNTAFTGNLLANTSITLTTGASIANGRALAVNGAVTLDTNAVTLAPPELSIGDVTVNEAAGTASFLVTLSRPNGVPVTLVATTTDGTAVAPGDYTSTSTPLTFAPGVVAQTVVVPIIGDALNEATETFSVVLSAPINATILDGTGVGTILDDDPIPTLAIDSVTVSEGAGTATFTVTLSATSGQVVSVNYATAPLTAFVPGDFLSSAGTLTFLPGGLLTQTIVVPIVDDAIFENTETFLVNLLLPVNATIPNGSGVGVGTILDDEPLPTLSIAGATTTEGNSGTASAVLVVTLSGLSSFPINVQYTTADGTALAGPDYTATSGTLTIPAGSLTGTITVPVLGDLLDEPDETFLVNLSAPVNAGLAVPQATGTILDDDAAPSISIGNATVTEGNAGTINAVFTVTLSAPSGRSITVDFATSDGTAAGGIDYTTASGTLTFLPGQTTQVITIAVRGDLIDEGDEAFLVTLTNASAATIAGAQGIGTILDDDGPAVDIPPVGVDDAYGTAQGTTLRATTPGVLANDSDAEGALLTTLLVSGTSNGVLALNLDGSFTYTPNARFVGIDSFTYRAIGVGNASNLATVTIAVRDLTGPATPALARFGFHASPTFLVLTFGEDLDPARAGDVANYRLTGPNGRRIALSSAVYDAATRTVTLFPARALKERLGYRLSINGSTAAGLADRSGNLLDGDADGVNGGNASLAFGRESLRILATTGPQRVLARRYNIPIVGEGAVSQQLFARMSSPRFLRLLARNTR